jgi:hypothetical protein
MIDLTVMVGEGSPSMPLAIAASVGVDDGFLAPMMRWTLTMTGSALDTTGSAIAAEPRPVACHGYSRSGG